MPLDCPHQESCLHPIGARQQLGCSPALPCWCDIREHQQDSGKSWDESYDEVKAWGSRCLRRWEYCSICAAYRLCGGRGGWIGGGGCWPCIRERLKV